MTKATSLVVEIKNEVPADASAVAVCVYADDPRVPDVARLGEGLREVCAEAVAAGEFEGEAGETLTLRVGDGAGSLRRVLLTGMGAHDEFDARGVRQAAGSAVRAARASRVRHLHFVAPRGGGVAASQVLRALAEGAHLGLYDNDFYQKHDEDSPALERLTVEVSDEAADPDKELERARVVAESVNWARSLADEPGLSLTPREFARRAAEMAEEVGLKVESLGEGEIRERGMGALLGVAQGSAEEPALIVLRYEPENASPDGELWAFVGKGITFDTGGISLKRGPGMEEMKSDMAGGAAALGALRAIAQLKPDRRVAAVVPATENMPSGSAVKPGDVVRTLAGQTIEVVDTDAEGRLVLVDGIAYAKQLGASRIVDLATLTGSIIVALGSHRTGLFSNDDAWADQVRAASERAGEPLWRMPVTDDYKKKIESDIADFKNYGGRPDATAAALLLSKFAGETPWAHLDIAGTAWYDAPQPHAPKGASGAGVRTLVELACGGGIRENKMEQES
jgi:leucyl aminopeptidase